MENSPLTKIINKKTISACDLLELTEALKQNRHIKINTEQFIKFCEKLLTKNVRLFLSLTSDIENITNTVKNKKQNLRLQSLLIHSYLLKCELNSALNLFLQHEKEWNLLPATKHELYVKIIDVLMEFEHYNKALSYLTEVINSTQFTKMKEPEQISIILNLATVLQRLGKTQICYNTKSATLSKLLIAINEVYFKVIKSTHNKKLLKHALNNYKSYCQSSDRSHELTANAGLNLPIIALLIENNSSVFASKQLNLLLKEQKMRSFTTLNIYEQLLPILKHSNINLYLNAVDEYITLSTQYKQQNVKIIKNSFNSTALASDLQTSFNLLKKHSHTDQLTGCLNRKALESIDISFKTDVGAIVYFDLNDLKPINDNYGHIIGDEYLVAFSNILLRFVNEDITVYRVGGDEFVLIANNHSKEKVTGLMNKIVTLSKKTIQLKGRPFIISFSAGISLYPNHSTQLHTLINLADKAMYKNKTTDKTHYYIFAKDKKQNPQ